MNTRLVGITAIAAGVLLVLIGLVILLTDGDDTPTPDASASSSTATTPETSSTTGVPATTVPTTTSTAPATTVATSTTAATTTSAATTTTTVAPPTTSAVSGADVQAFAAAYASATEAGDVEFLFERLHPVVIASSDEATCRAFVEREIVQITGYRLTGPIEQTVQTFDIAGSQVTVDPLFRVEATFTFQGQEVTDTALFAPVDGELRWFSVCR